MQSLQRHRRQLHAHRDLQDRHRPELRAGAGAEPGLERARVAAAGGAGAGRHRPEEVDRDPAVRDADLAGRPLRQPVSRQLRHHQSARTSSRACPASAMSTCSAPASTRCGSGSIPNKLQARSLTAQDVINALQQQSQQVTAGQIGTPPVPTGQAFQYTVDVAGRLDRSPQFEDIVVKTDTANGGRSYASARRRPRRARRADLQPDLHAQRQAGRRHRHLPVARRQRARRRPVRSASAMDELAKTFPPGLAYSIPFDTTKFVSASIDEVYKTLIEAGDPGADRDPGVPAGLARHAGAGDHRAGDHHRRLRRHGGARLHRQPLDPVRASCWRSASWSTTPSWWSRARRTTSSGACRGHDAAIEAMNELFGPIIGITLVLMAVFLPAAFLPGLTGQMYRAVRAGDRRHRAASAPSTPRR